MAGKVVGNCPRCGSPIYEYDLAKVKRTCNCKELLDAKEMGVTYNEREAADSGGKQVLHG